jgi:hypothetical protein
MAETTMQQIACNSALFSGGNGALDSWVGFFMHGTVRVALVSCD